MKTYKSLLDQLMPQFEYSSVHSIAAPRPVDVVYAAADSYRMEESRVTGLLFRLRGLPVQGSFRQTLLGMGFIVLAEEAGREVVLGSAGRFALGKRLGVPIPIVGPDEFVALESHGVIKLVANLSVEADAEGDTILSTETRVRCIGRKTRLIFGSYWSAVKPFSGLIRMELLRGIRRHSL